MSVPILWYFADPMCSWGYAQLNAVSHGCQPLDTVRAAIDRSLPSE